MRVIAIDGSPIRGGTITAAVETAARTLEAAGADVERVRLYERYIRCCTGCGGCRSTGVCDIEDDLTGLARSITGADGLLIGTSGNFRRTDAALQSLLARLTRVTRGSASQPAMSADAHVALIAAVGEGAGLSGTLGMSPTSARRTARSLAACGLRPLGVASVPGPTAHPSDRDAGEDRARALASRLAATCASRPHRSVLVRGRAATPALGR